MNPKKKSKKENYTKEINDINHCIRDIHSLQSCNIGFITAHGLETIQSCKDLIASNKPIIRKTADGLNSNVFSFTPSGEWKIAEERINRDHIKYVFINKRNDTIQLTVSDKIHSDKFESNKDLLKKGIEKLWLPESMELISHKITNI